jgi:soluble lytic murein transglycosylase-like protein
MFAVADSTDRLAGLWRACRRVMSRRNMLLALAVAAPFTASAQIYTGTAGADGGGVVLSNFQTEQTPTLLVAAPRADSPSAAPQAGSRAVVQVQPIAAPAELLSVIADVARRVDIDPELLKAVITVESRYDPRALSPKGAIGLMQLLPSTAKRFGARDPYLPHQNILAGASYLKWLMAMFAGDLELVLAAYNAGENAVLKAGRKIPPYPETQAYVPRVLAHLRCAQDAACKAAVRGS